jgi:hypothetical protein
MVMRWGEVFISFVGWLINILVEDLLINCWIDCLIDCRKLARPSRSRRTTCSPSGPTAACTSSTGSTDTTEKVRTYLSALFYLKNYNPIPRRGSISRPITAQAETIPLVDHAASLARNTGSSIMFTIFGDFDTGTNVLITILRRK